MIASVKFVYTFATTLVLKKLLVTILAFLYLTTSVGATVHLHYCMDRLVDWSLAGDEEKECSNCGMHKDAAKGCCKDEHKQVKFQGEQKMSSILTLLFSPIVYIPLAQVEMYNVKIYSSLAVTYPVSHAPPERASVPVYLSNRVFRI
jgi:hypothetical protein